MSNPVNNSGSNNQSVQSQAQAQPQANTEKSAQPAKEQPTKAEIRKMKLKLEGQEVEMPEDEVIKYAQLGKTSNKRFQEAAQKERRAEEFFRLLKSDPRKVLSDPSIGVDLYQFATEYLAEHIQNETMDPREKEYREKERKLREYEEKEKKAKKEEEERQIKQLEDHHAENYTKIITDALKIGGIPKTNATVKRMASLMSKNLDLGLDLEPAQLATLVREDYIKEMNELFGAADEDGLLALVGDSFANKIRKADLKRLKSAQPKFDASQKGVTGGTEAPQKKMTRDEWEKKMERIKKGLE